MLSQVFIALLFLSGGVIPDSNNEKSSITPILEKGAVQVFEWSVSDSTDESEFMGYLSERTHLELPSNETTSLLWYSYIQRETSLNRIRWVTNRTGLDVFLESNGFDPDDPGFDRFNIEYKKLLEYEKRVEKLGIGWNPREIVDYRFQSTKWVQLFWGVFSDDCVVAYILEDYR